MLDLKLLDKSFDDISKKLQSKGVSSEQLAKLQQANHDLKTAKAAFEQAQSKQNELSKQFGVYKKEGSDITPLKQELDANKVQITELQSRQREKQEDVENLALSVANIPDERVPVGSSEADNVELKKVLTPRAFTFTPKEHWELSDDWIDFERGVKIAKSRITVLKGAGAKLQRALQNYMLDFNSARGFAEISVPELVNAQALYGTGQLPKFEDDLFSTQDGLYLIPTAEVPLTNLYQDEIIPQSDLPIKMTAFSSCFRKEAGSAGRDTRGIIRQHQFQKVELVSLCTPQQSDELFNEMVQCASDLLTSLALPHRLVNLCSGDLGFSAAYTTDLEVWLPGQNCYREISSVSNTHDFQARRAKIRFKEEKKNRFVHTLNGSSLAIGRTIVAIMENYQQEDGSIAIPDVLLPYMKE